MVENGVTTNIPYAHVTSGNIVFNGNAGNDRFDNQTALRALATGGPGADVLFGGSGADYMLGGLGEDYLMGNGGSDQLFANSDTDFATDTGYNYLNGGDGLDYVHGSRGPDNIDGGRGEDYLFGYGGDDTLSDAYGSGGDGSYNYINAGDGNDSVHGGDGPDYIDAGAGNDTVRSYGGDDRVWGYAGNDSIVGGSGNDTLYGGAGIDALDGEAGHDGLFGGIGDGRDTLVGASGADRFLMPAAVSGAQEDTITDRSTADARLIFQASPAIVDKYFSEKDVYCSFNAGAWDNTQIERIDAGLVNLHRHTNNTRLLKTQAGGEMSFLAVGQQTKGQDKFIVGGWNTGTQVAMVNPAGKAIEDVRRIVYHEFGHNWDTAVENRHVGAFQAISGWVKLDKAQAGYTHSTGQNDWYYLSSAAGTFARDYGKTNPNEDFATSWAAYFVNAYDGGAAALVTVHLSANADKWANFDMLFADIRS